MYLKDVCESFGSPTVNRCKTADKRTVFPVMTPTCIAVKPFLLIFY
jgi:hypothetical protein